MANKKDVAAVASDSINTLKNMLKKYPDDAELKSELARLEKKQDEAIGTMKSIGPCFSCKKSELVNPKDYEYRHSRWFMCPHKDLFCYDCIRKEVKTVLGKRKEEREAKKKEKAEAKKGGKK